MLLQQVAYFKTNSTAYNTLIIDTADWAERLCKTHVCDTAKKDGIESFGYGKGYTYLAEEFGRLLNHLSDLIGMGMNVVLVAHAAMRKFEQPDEMGSYDRWELKMEKKVYPLIKEWADLILFANYKTLVINVDNQGAEKGKNKAQGGKRIMYTTHHPCWDAKNRHDLLEELPFDYCEIAHCIPARGGSTPSPKQIDPPKQDVEQQFNQMVEQPPTTETAKPNNSGTIADFSDLERKSKPEIPKALADLMELNQVDIDEIYRVVAHRGYYPLGTPIANFDPSFVSGVLVGAWPQVFGMIKELREVPL